MLEALLSVSKKQGFASTAPAAQSRTLRNHSFLAQTGKKVKLRTTQQQTEMTAAMTGEAMMEALDELHNFLTAQCSITQTHEYQMNQNQLDLTRRNSCLVVKMKMVTETLSMYLQ